MNDGLQGLSERCPLVDAALFRALAVPGRRRSAGTPGKRLPCGLRCRKLRKRAAGSSKQGSFVSLPACIDHPDPKTGEQIPAAQPQATPAGWTWDRWASSLGLHGAERLWLQRHLGLHPSRRPSDERTFVACAFSTFLPIWGQPRIGPGGHFVQQR